MIKEIQKRPFVRPLFIWITGILFYACLPYTLWIPVLLSFIFGVLLLAFVGRNKNIYPAYDARWSWGAIFVCSLLILSVLVTAYLDSDIMVEGEWRGEVANYMECLKENYLERLNTLDLSENERKVLGTILLGDTKNINKEILARFSITGVIHILSVSGFHVAVVCGFLSLLLRPFPSHGLFRWIKYLMIMGLLWGFTLITGLAPPSIRAAIMLSLFLTGRALGRMTDGYNTLAASAFCMLVYNPFYLFDIGFQLSYIAVLFILLLQPLLTRLLTIRNPLLSEPYNWIVIAIAAQTGTAFLCLYYFNRFPALFLFTNLPFSFVSTILIPAGLIYILLPSGFPGIDYLAICIQEMTRFLLYIVDSFSLLPWASFVLPFDFVDLLLGYGFLLLAVLSVYRKRPSYLLLSISLLIVLFAKFLLEKAIFL